ncbi:MAG: hypothetical protein ABI193_06900 [Minicystis sp.]
MEMPAKDAPAEAYLPKSTYTVARVAAKTEAAGLEKPLAAQHEPHRHRGAGFPRRPLPHHRTGGSASGGSES